MTVAALVGGSTLRSRAVVRTPETGTLADAPEIASYLLARLRPGDRIVVANPCGPPLDYYLLRQGGPRLDEINAQAGRGRVYVIVNPSHLQTLASVQATEPDIPWSSLILEGAPMSFAPETVLTMRFAHPE